MKTRFLRLAIALLTICPVLLKAQVRGAGVSNEATVSATGKVYALVVGISDYKELPKLKYADIDAKTFAGYLKAVSGADTNNIKLLTNADANRVNLITQLMSIKKSAGRGDKVYIYFAGHGDIETEISNGGILLLYDSPKESYYMNPNGFLHETDLKNIISQITKSQAQVFLITDACHSGSFSGGSEGGSKNLLALKQEWGNENKVFSCQANEFSMEGAQWGNGRGLFSYHLVEGLTGLADEEGEKDGKVTLFELQAYLQRYVRQQAAPNKQTPFVVGNLDNTVATVSPSLLASLKESKSNNYPLFAMAGGRGIDILADLDVAVYNNFKTAMNESRLVEPDKNNAVWFYSQLTAKTKNDAAKDLLTRDLVSALLNRSAEIINPLLSGDVTYASSSKVALAVKEMNKAMELLGPEHYLTANFKARKLFLEAVQLTLNKEDEKNPGNVSNALKKLQESIALEPYAYYAYYQSGYLYNLQKKSQQAIDNYTKYLSFLPKDPEALNNVGVSYYNMGDYTKAIEYYNKSLALKPSARAYTNIGLAYIKTNDAVKANDNFDKAIALGKDNLNTYFIVGKNYFDNNSADKALTYLNKAASLNANHAPTLYYLGLTSLGKNDTTKALDYFSKAIASDARYAEPYQKRAEIYSAKKQFDKAAKDYDAAIMLNPKLWDCYQALGKAYIELKQYDKAIDALENAVMTDRRLGKTLYLTLGNLYRDNLKSYERANGYYQKYLELNPMDGRAHAETAMNFVYLKNYTAAEQSLQRATTLSPSDPIVKSTSEALTAAKTK